jgi:microcystin-dependent protein
LAFTSDNSIQNTAFTNEIRDQIQINTNKNTLMPVASIIITAQRSNPAPEGYLYCHGGLFSKSIYSELYAIIGNMYAYSKALSSTEFYVPDMRQLYVKGMGLNETYSAIETAPTGMGIYQTQQVQDHGHSYYSANTSETTVRVDSTTPTQTVGSNNYTDNVTYDKWLYGKKAIPGENETRPETISMNYMIKY